MKKSFLIFLTVLPFLGGCQKQSNKALIERKDNPSSQIMLDSQSLTEKIAFEHSFILQIADPSCRCSIDFSTILENIMTEKEIMIYKIYGSDFLNAPISKEVQYYSTGLAIFNRGKASISIDAFGKWTHEIENPHSTSSSKPILKFIQKYCYLDSPFYALDKDELFAKIADNELFKVYYHRSGCSDCKYFNRNFLDEWLLDKNNSKYKIYSFDLQPYYPKNSSEEENSLYQQLKDDLGLSVNGNPVYGYKTGVVPSLQVYNKGLLIDMAVFYNEDIEINYKTNRSVTVIDDYYHQFCNREFLSYDIFREVVTEFYITKFLEIVESEY